MLDAGCGEGYYTAGLFGALAVAGRESRLAGVDLSKPSVRLAAKRLPHGEFAVASVYRLPVGRRQIDLLLNCFSPLALDEFRRVLKPGGVYLYVVPGPEHLWQLKQVLYERPYPNPEQAIPYEGFSYERIVPVEADLAVEGAALQDLFRMTPYYWKTPRAGAQRPGGAGRAEDARFVPHSCVSAGRIGIRAASVTAPLPGIQNLISIPDQPAVCK